MTNIFISYKREDAATAELLKDLLETQGFSVWWDHALMSGDEFRDVIRDRINTSDAVVVLWSPLSVQSPFVRDEAGWALKQKKLLPALLERCDLPFGFGELHTEDLTTWRGDGSHPGVVRLLKALGNKVSVRNGVPPQPGAQNAKRAGRKQSFARRWLGVFVGAFVLLAIVAASVLALQAGWFTPASKIEPAPPPPTGCLPGIVEEDAWTNASDLDASIDALGDYIRKCPDGAHRKEADGLLLEHLDDQAWSAAAETRTVDAYVEYLQKYPEGAHAPLARKTLFTGGALATDRSAGESAGCRTQPDEFSVYFEYDRADLTSNNRYILSAAASRAKAGGCRLSLAAVAVHNDARGTTEAARRTADARGNVIKQALIEEGFEEARIIVQQEGELDWEVPGAPREPLNRRAIVRFTISPP